MPASLFAKNNFLEKSAGVTMKKKVNGSPLIAVKQSLAPATFMNACGATEHLNAASTLLSA